VHLQIEERELEVGGCYHRTSERRRSPQRACVGPLPRV